MCCVFRIKKRVESSSLHSHKSESNFYTFFFKLNWGESRELEKSERECETRKMNMRGMRLVESCWEGGEERKNNIISYAKLLTTLFILRHLSLGPPRRTENVRKLM